MDTTISSQPRTRELKLNFLTSLLQWESVLFAAICMVDMVTTLYWVHNGQATEANPLLARVLQEGDFQFCLTKLISFVPMLLLAAWYRLQQPKFIAVALRLGVAAYVVIYAVAVGSEFIR